MRISRLLLSGAILALFLGAPARAELLVQVDKAAQQMTVTVDGEQRYVWPVSTGRDGYSTPSGEYKPFRMERDHFSEEWDDAPMPFSIFFTQQGHAIHGTYDAKHLGQPVSHGCVRISRANAAILWGLVRQHKMANTRVELKGDAPKTDELVAKRGTGNDGANAKRRDTQRDEDASLYNDEDDQDVPVPPQRKTRVTRDGWREYRDGPRYYYRSEPYYVRRYYDQPFIPFFGR